MTSPVSSSTSVTLFLQATVRIKKRADDQFVCKRVNYIQNQAAHNKSKQEPINLHPASGRSMQRAQQTGRAGCLGWRLSTHQYRHPPQNAQCVWLCADYEGRNTRERGPDALHLTELIRHEAGRRTPRYGIALVVWRSAAQTVERQGTSRARSGSRQVVTLWAEKLG